MYILLSGLTLLGAVSWTSALAETGALIQTEVMDRCGAVPSEALPPGIKPGVYQGKLGTQAITLELSGRSVAEYPDRYGYDRYGLNIGLERGKLGSRLVAAETGEQTPDADACLDLAADGTGLKGTWRSADGKKTFPVTLSRLNVATIPLALPASPGLLRLRASDLFTFRQVNTAWVNVPGGRKEPLTGITYPHLAKGTAALNAALQDRQLALVQEALDCKASASPTGTDFNGRGAISWQSRNLLSLREQVDYYCGGAYPDFETTGVTLDVHTGLEVNLTGTPASIWPGLSDEKLHVLYLKKTGEVAFADLFRRFEIYLAPGGLTLYPADLPHAIGASRIEVTISYTTLRTLADPKGKYFRDIYPR